MVCCRLPEQLVPVRRYWPACAITASCTPALRAVSDASWQQLRHSMSLTISSPQTSFLPLHRKTVSTRAGAIKSMKKSWRSVATSPPLHPTYDLKEIIRVALKEDSGSYGDVTCMATIPADMEVEAHFLCKEDGIIAGIALADMIFNEVDASLQTVWSRNDGDNIHRGLQFGKVHGRALDIIVAERVVLNFMQRMSGIATLTKAMAEAAFPAIILETRKTAPCLRLVDKWAVSIGGGRNHRMGLFDMVLIKDNHISSAGSITKALASVDYFLQQRNLNMEFEAVFHLNPSHLFLQINFMYKNWIQQNYVVLKVETRTLEEVEEVLQYASCSNTSLTRVMLDNMVILQSNGDVDASMLRKAVVMINGRFETEASGNVTLETLPSIGCTGVTYVSSGALTHSVKALDISLKIDMELALEVGRRSNRV